MHAMKLFIAILLLISSAAPHTTQFTVEKGVTDADDLPVSGASICAPASSACYQMPAINNGTVTYEFGLQPEMKVLVEDHSTQWILFDATFSGGGSGTLTRYAVLVWDGIAFKNLLPRLALTNVSDFDVWDDKNLSAYPILVTADFDWNFKAHETHFGRHFFTVDVWQYSPTANIYIKVIKYKTSKRYDGGDSSDVSVIKPERKEIIRRLNSLHPNP
jgi:hypothetical protein